MVSQLGKYGQSGATKNNKRIGTVDEIFRQKPQQSVQSKSYINLFNRIRQDSVCQKIDMILICTNKEGKTFKKA